jgi:GNAT superfamily N-acetyltransferase
MVWSTPGHPVFWLEKTRVVDTFDSISGAVFVGVRLRLLFAESPIGQGRQASLRIGSHESVRIDLLREGDLPAALRIQEAEHWNQIAPDWIRLLRLNPQGCFAAFSEGELIGTVTVITYGERLAWIGMMLVARECRGRGIGKQLMRTALDHCQHRHIATVKLDATPAGRPLYESLGFIPENTIERWHGAGSSRGQTNPRPFSTDRAPLSLYWLDEQAFRVSRKEVLNSLLGDCCVAPGFHPAQALVPPT